MTTKKTTADSTTAEQEAKKPAPKKKTTGARAAKLQQAAAEQKTDTASTAGADVVENMERVASEQAAAVPPESKPAKPFKKPSSDYYNLDLVIREVDRGKMTEQIKVDYKDYVATMASFNRVSIARYIQDLIEADRKKPANRKKYNEAKADK